MNKKIFVVGFLLLFAGCWLLTTGSAAEPVHIEWDPNPFLPNEETTKLINTDFEKEDTISLTIYDLKSRVVRYLVEEKEAEGLGALTWNGRNQLGEIVPVGLYIWQLKINKRYQLGTVVVVKRN